MRFAFLVGDLGSEQPVYTTTTVALAAQRRGHEVFYADVTGFAWTAGGLALHVHAADARDQTGEAFLARLLAARREPLPIEQLDLLWLRCAPSNPFTDPTGRADMAFQFGLVAERSGVRVLSDPATLAVAVADKAYTHSLPPEVQPPTLVSSDAAEIAGFVRDLGGSAVLKPLQGFSGESVFFVGAADPNLHPAIEAVARLGYVVAQEYLPQAAHGVTRLFMLGGRPFEAGGRTAVMLHLPKDSDRRTNYRVSRTIAPAELDPGAVRVADAVGPRLGADGLFLVALDIVDGTLLEANVYAPGGLRGAERVVGVDFSSAVVDALETAVRGA